MKRFTLAIAMIGLALAGCSGGTPPPQASAVPEAAAVPPPPKIADLPVTMKVKQRSTTPVPGADEQLSLTVDDITRGQVMVSLIGKEGKALSGPMSLEPGEAAKFQFGDTEYSLKLTRLDNALVGDDFATLTIAEAGSDLRQEQEKSESLTEQEKIERLVAVVEAMEGAVFIRNGAEHSAQEAADHLRQKLAAAGGKITTAAEFIDHIASKSSLTGREYQLKFSDGRTAPAGEFLHEQLEKLEAGR